MKKIYAGSLLLLFFYTNASAQKYNINFEHLTSDDGLSENVVDAVFQDARGFLWIGTDEGLDEYDGYEFTVYKNNPLDPNSISDNFIHYIYEDKTGMLWITTSKGGLNKLDRRKNIFIRYFYDSKNQESISSNNVNMVCEDDYKNFWVCTEKGLDLMNRTTGKFKRYYGNGDSLYNRLAESYVNVLFTKKDILWVGTRTGFYRINVLTGTIKNYENDPKNKYSISSNFITSICEDNQSCLWIGTFGGGLCRFDSKTEKFITFRHKKGNPNSLSSDFIHSILIDKNNYLWVGTSNDGGLNVFDKATKKFYIYKNQPANVRSLSENEVQCLYEDKAGTIWIGTFGGLNKFDTKGKKFQTYSTDSGNAIRLSEKEIHAIFEDSKNMLWIGTWGGGLDRIDPKSQKLKVYKNNSTNPRSISSNDITCILEDTKKRLWVGTADGLNRFDNHTNDFTVFKHNPISYSFYDNAVLTLFEDREGTLWIGTWMQGLFKYNEKSNSFTVYKNDPANPASLSSNMVTSIYEDQGKNLWIGTWDGLNKFNRERNSFVAFKNDRNDPTSISNNSIICTLEDPAQKGRFLWLGTWTGLDKFDMTTCKSVIYRSSSYAFQSDNITGLLSDNENRLWIATNKGLTRFDPNNGLYRTYDKSDGLQGNEFQGRACYKSVNGELFFGGDKGVSYFFPDSLNENSYLPPVVITSFKKFNKEAKLPQDISFVHNMELSYKDYVFSFGFSALNFIHPEKNKFRYKLVGFDRDWVNAENSRTATYTNLDPGDYIFLVKAANNDGIWNPVPASINITITPPFWGTWWFRLLGLSGIVLITLFIINKRTAKIRKEKNLQEEFSRKLIESQEKERKRIAGELHDSLAQNLLIIKNKALHGINNLKDVDVLSEQLDNISELSSSTLSDVREIAYNLHPYQLDRLGLTKAIQSIFDRIRNTTPIKFNVTMDLIDEIFNADVEINIFRIIQECINNIIKHSYASEVNFSVIAEDEQVAISLSDNGKGFILLDFNKSANGQGLGLRNISERVKLIRGRFDIRSEPGHGTDISITIPLYPNRNLDGS